MGLLFILLIPWITSGLPTFITDSDTYWQSTSKFTPISSTKYGTIRLRQHMTMSLMIEWYGRVSNPPSVYEQITRIGWTSTSGGCNAQNSRYPSLWIDNLQNVFHLSISQHDSCGEGWRLSSYTIEKYKIYSIFIEFTDDFIYMTINDTIVLDQKRSSPTRPSFINQLMNVYIASDYWSTPYIIANVSLWNINIQSMNPPIPTINPTYVPTDYPTIIPTPIPSTTTYSPSYLPTNTPSTNPTNLRFSSTTQNPTLFPTMQPTIPTMPTNYPIKFETSSIIFELHKEPEKMDTSQVLYLLILGIASCIIGTCLILITVKKCGDLKKGHKKLRSQAKKLSFQVEKNENIEMDQKVQFEVINNDIIPLKPGKHIFKHISPQKLPHISPHISSSIPSFNDKYIIKVSPDTPSNISGISNISKIYPIDEGNNNISDDNTHVRVHMQDVVVDDNDNDDENASICEVRETQIIGFDGMDETETILTRTESMSPSNAGSRLHTAMRKYLMSESNEEEYIKAVMEQAVVIHKYKIPLPTQKVHNLVVITDNNNNVGVIDLDGKEEEKHVILDDDDDDETLPILPGTNTTVTLNDGESLSVEYNVKLPIDIGVDDGYEWVTMALLQIDDEDWRVYLNNFKRNKVMEHRLIDLKRCDMKELIPKIGPRNEFEKLLRIKLGAAQSEIYDNSEY